MDINNKILVLNGPKLRRAYKNNGVKDGKKAND